MEYIVDVQGFKRSFNRFVFKEVAILAAQADAVPTVLHFKSPCRWEFLPSEHKSCNAWLKHNMHGLSWEDGNIPYDKLEQTLNGALEGSTTVYVKGLEKKMWLKEVLPTKRIVNIEDLGCPSLQRLPKDGSMLCSMHVFTWPSVCAAQNAQSLKNWLLQHRSRTALSWTGQNLGWEAEGVDEVDKEKLYS